MATENVEKKIDAIVITSFGGGDTYSNLSVIKEEYPKLESDSHVIVRIKAVGLNFAELMQRQGFYKPQVKPPYTPGFEGSGIVEKVGVNVTNVKEGDRVNVTNSHNIWKEVVSVIDHNVVKIPDKMTFEEAAGLMVNYITAYQILFDFANLRPGLKVLIHMAAGGVGIAAAQLCKTVPNVTVFGTASLEKHDKIKAQGVDHPIDYRTKNYVDEVKRISPEGVDIVLDPLNGEDAIKGYSLLRPFGKIIHYGAASMTTEGRSLFNVVKTWWKCLQVNSLNILADNKSVSGYHLGYLLNNPIVKEKMAADVQKLMELFEQGKISIQIDSEFPFSKIGEAMHHMHSRKNVGKIILKPDSEFKPASK